MLTYRVLSLLLSLAIILISCNDKLKQEVKSKYEALLKGHDEVMPKTMKINKLKTELLASVESLSEYDSLKIEAVSISSELQSADDAMYTWMDDFGKALNDIKDLEEKSKRYDELSEQIAAIHMQTEDAMARANNLIANTTK